jgi:predicted GH43/DUF377 family glycosyl hydrolase
LSNTNTDKKLDQADSGVFEWQFSDSRNEERYARFRYNEDLFWGGFPPDPLPQPNAPLPRWAIGPFVKHPANPVFAPAPDGWDRGRFGGGVHNGSVLVRDGLFTYVYRGEMPHPPTGHNPWEGGGFDYICDIGLATSADGIRFERDARSSPFFRRGEDCRYSFEDVCLVQHEATYYLFCNRMDWRDVRNPTRCGVFLATSPDMLHWEPHGLVFPQAAEMHRNACVLQTPDNRALRVDGCFVMYLNNHLIAYSEDLLRWKSRKIAEPARWPGGEGCFAVGQYDPRDPDKVVLFTGGHHTGHFYAIGEVLFSCRDLARPLAWLPRPVLSADPALPWENGQDARRPAGRVSYYRDTVFFTGMTQHHGSWWLYYGGSEYYTCLAQAPCEAAQEVVS